MSGHKKRKAATFSKKDCDYTIDFNKNMEVVGKNVNDFTTWFGVHLKANFPYYIPTDKFEDHKWEELWMDMKKTWNITTDAPKDTLLKKARKKHTNWRSYLNTNFVKKQEKPFETYPSLLEEEHCEKHWEDFVIEKTSSESMAKSEKASASANANINHNTLGRHGFANFDFESVWSQLLPMYSCLQNIQDERSKKWITSLARKDKSTKKYKLEEDTKISSAYLANFEKEMKEDGSYFSGKEDPLTRLLGPEHGGRSRTTSHVIGKSKVHGGLFKDGKQKSQKDLTQSADEVLCYLPKFGQADEQNITYHQIDKTIIENYEDEVWNEDDEAKSCPKCHRNLLLMSNKGYQGTSRNEVPKQCSGCSNLDKDLDATINGIISSNDDRRRPLAKVAYISKTCEGVNANNPRDLSLSVNHQHANTTVDSIGLWKGIVLGQSEKDMLEAIYCRYPETFQRVKIRSNRRWVTILEDLHVFIKRFLDSSVGALAVDGITSLEEDLDDFENLGFDLSWARKRVEMVKTLKFGNDPLKLKLMIDDESVKVTWKEMDEANARLEKARLDYHRAVDTRAKTVDEMAQKFGAKYDDVLKGTLGFGMLPGY